MRRLEEGEGGGSALECSWDGADMNGLGALVFIGNLCLVFGALLLIFLLHVALVSAVEAFWLAKVSAGCDISINACCLFKCLCVDRLSQRGSRLLMIFAHKTAPTLRITSHHGTNDNDVTLIPCSPNPSFARSARNVPKWRSTGPDDVGSQSTSIFTAPGTSNRGYPNRTPTPRARQPPPTASPHPRVPSDRCGKCLHS